MQVIRWIGIWLCKLEIFFHWDDSTAENTNAMDLSDFLRMERGETSPILKALEKVLEVGLSFLLIVLLVWGLVCLLLRFGQRYQNGKRITRSTEECEEIRENLKQKDAGGNERRIRHIFRTSEQKIRFIYVRAVKRAALNLQIRGIEPGTDVDGRKYGENSWKRVVHFYRFLSPHELNCAISMEKQVEDEDGLRCLYEQARYGEKPVTRQMVAQAKKAAGQVNRTEIQRHNRNIET
jgi:hypothetical protein